MRHGLRFILTSILTLATTPLFAQARTNYFRIFVHDLGYVESESQGGHTSGGLGIALGHRWNEQWSTELSIAGDRHRMPVTIFRATADPAGNSVPVPVTETASLRTYPVDLLTNYHFLTMSRVSPFVGAGVRYVRAPHFDGGVANTTIITTPPATDFVPVRVTSFDDRLSPELAAGLSVRLSPGMNLNVGAERLLRGDRIAYDPRTRARIGIDWRF